jgi:hypothetical protein
VGSLFPSELADINKIKKQSMSQVLNHLEELKLVRRSVSREDKRKMAISLTELTHSFGRDVRAGALLITPPISDGDDRSSPDGAAGGYLFAEACELSGIGIGDGGGIGWGVCAEFLGVASAAVGSLSLFLLHTGSPLVVVIGVSVLVGLITGFNPIANQASLNEMVPAELSGFSFGLYRTFVCLGAVGSGALLKTIFHKGVTDASFREIAWWTVCSSLVMMVLYLPVLFARRGRVGPGVETPN